MSEHVKARQWRENHGWSLDQLSAMTGYSASSIFWFEKGRTPAGTPIDEYAWWRYKRICSAVDVDPEGKQFKWGGA